MFTTIILYVFALFFGFILFGLLAVGISNFIFYTLICWKVKLNRLALPHEIIPEIAEWEIGDTISYYHPYRKNVFSWECTSNNISCTYLGITINKKIILESKARSDNGKIISIKLEDFILFLENHIYCRNSNGENYVKSIVNKSLEERRNKKAKDDMIAIEKTELEQLKDFNLAELYTEYQQLRK